jgi:phage terminase large subunit-like protein
LPKYNEMTRTIPQPPTNIAGYDPLRTAGECTWDGEEAARAVDFFPLILRHPDDTPFNRAGTPIELQPWQQDFVATLFGWKRPDGSRRYREAPLFIPRKNGKSTLAAGLLLYQIVADMRQGAQYYCAAETRDQASLIFNMCARMVRSQPKLSKRLKIIDSTKRLTYQQMGSYFRAVPNEKGIFHGTKPACVAFDELHLQRNRDTWDGAKTAFGTSLNPLMLIMSTAGIDRHSICYEVWTVARNVRDGTNPADHILPCIYELPEGAQWDDEGVWHEVNPNLGVTISLDFLRQECQQAKDSFAYENTFRNLYLNQWTEQAVRWIQMDKWRLGNEPVPGLDGEPCWLAVDLSSQQDITALVAAFPRPSGGFYLKCKFWVPGDSAHKRERMDNVPYRTWQRDGHLEFTHAGSIDDQAIRKTINEWASRYEVQEIAFDPWNAKRLQNDLIQDGFESRIVEHRPGMPSMGPPTKIFDRLITDGHIQHGNNPVLTWMAGNVAVVFDTHENFRPCKEKSTERIDGIVAAVMAVGRAATNQAQTWFYSNNPVEIG